MKKFKKFLKILKLYYGQYMNKYPKINNLSILNVFYVVSYEGNILAGFI